MRLGCMVVTAALMFVISAVPQEPASQPSKARPARTGAVLLGSGAPAPDPDRSGLAAGVALDDHHYLVGIGPGVVRAAEAVQPGSSESEVREALAKFIHAFDDLDWEGFRLAFADDATVFYPRAFPERANGRAEFEKTFKTVFEQIRAGRTAGPYMDIQPKDLHIQIFGGIAIATFHLDDRPGFLNRRTIVLDKTRAGWKIVHLHASEVAIEGTRM